MAGQGCLRVFHRYVEPNLVAEVLGYAQTILPRPAETYVVRRIDGHRRSFSTVVHTMLGFRDQAPHLTTGETPSVVEHCLAPGLPIPQRIAVALIVVGSHTRGEEVRFEVAGHLRAGESPFCQHGYSRLAGRA